MIALIAAAGAAIGVLLALLRMFAGPTLHDRALGAYAVVVRAALACAAMAVLAGRSDWVDAAIALMLSAFVVNTAMLKLFRVRSFQAPLARAGEEIL